MHDDGHLLRLCDRLKLQRLNLYASTMSSRIHPSSSPH